MAKNDYDRILRENIQEIFIHYVERILEIEVAETKPIPVKLTGTFDMEVDHLVEAVTKSGERILLHFEFQTWNDANMLRRIKRYHGFLYHKYGIPIHHFVIYLGNNKPSMRHQLQENEILRGFHLITLADQKLEGFLSARNPEEIILGILSDFGSREVREGIQKIIGALQYTSPDEVQLNRYLHQLKILSRIRNLDGVVQEMIEKMPLNLDPRDSYDYKLGVKEGLEEGLKEGLKVQKDATRAMMQLISEGLITTGKAAEVLGISVQEMTQRIEEVKLDADIN